MSAPVQIAIALASVLVLLGLMAVVRRIATAHEIGPEMQRKLVHIGTGLYALTLPWLFPDRWPVYLLVGVTLVVMLVLRLPKIATTGLGATLHGVERHSYGDLMLAIAVGMCLFLSGDQPWLYVLPIAILTRADAAAALAGSSYGRKFFIVEEGRKSIEGSVVFFTLSFLISLVCLMLMTPLPPVNMLLIFLATHAQKDPLSLAVLAVGFAISVITFLSVAGPLGLTRHSARVYVIALFLLLAATAFHNAVVPLLVLFVHAWTRSTNPGAGRFPDLDVVAAVALISFGSLVLGQATGWNAVSFYGVVMMGLATGLAALALVPQPVWQRVAALLALAALLCLLRQWALAENPASANWAGPLWGVVLASLLLTALVPSRWPRKFYHRRMAKLSLLALILPLSTYLYAIAMDGG